MSSPIDGLIDEIDRLVDEQLTIGERAPTFPKCWHCGRQEHYLVITERIAQMYAAGQFDENYRLDADDSRVLCRGSDFIGPMPVESEWKWLPNLGLSVNTGAPDWITSLIRVTQERLDEALGFIGGHPGFGFSAMGALIDDGPPRIIGQDVRLWPQTQRRWWRTTLPSGSAVTHRFSSLTMTVETGDNSQTFPEEDVRFNFRESGPLVISVLSEFAPDIGGTWEPITAPGVTEYPEGR